MKCPFCETFLKSAGLICPTCKSDLPKAELFPIYKKILNEQRDLGKSENRKQLDESALHEYQIRIQLTEDAKKKESERQRVIEIERKESQRKLQEENAQKAEVLKEKRAKSNRIIGRAVIVVLVILSILGTGKFTSNRYEDRKIAKDCLTLNTPFGDDGADQAGALVDIANLSFLIKNYPYSPYFNFKAAHLYLDQRNSVFLSQVYQSEETDNFIDNYTKNASKISKLLQKGRIGQAINDVKQDKVSLRDLAAQQLALFNSYPCFDDVTEKEKAIEGLPTNSKLRSAFTSQFLAPKPTPEPTTEPRTKPTTEPRTKPTTKPTTTPTVEPKFASASVYLQTFMSLSMDCRQLWNDINHANPLDGSKPRLDTSADCHSSDIWVNKHGENGFSVYTDAHSVTRVCTNNSSIIPTPRRNVMYFQNSEAYFIIQANKGNVNWLNDATAIIMNTFGAKFCG